MALGSPGLVMKPGRRLVFSGSLLAPASQLLGAGMTRAQIERTQSHRAAGRENEGRVPRARALREQALREGDQAYGAVLVCSGMIVGERCPAPGSHRARGAACGS
jgi:hypothetical protein